MGSRLRSASRGRRRAKVAHHAREQSHAIRRLSGYISSASESGTTSSDGDEPPATDTYTKEMDCHIADNKGKDPTKKW